MFCIEIVNSRIADVLFNILHPAGGVIPRKSKTMDNGHLLIPLLRAEDEGCYRCNMNNTSGAVFAEACLSVLGRFFFFDVSVSSLTTDFP